MISQQHGCGTHGANSVRSVLDGKGIQLFSLLVQSPDMYLIENARAIIERNLREKSMNFTAKDVLFRRLNEVWNSLLNEYFEKVIVSTSKRMKGLKDAGGLFTKCKNFH